MLAQSRCGCRSRHSPEVRVIFSNYPFDRYAGELIRIFFPLDFQYKWNLVETKMQKKKKKEDIFKLLNRVYLAAARFFNLLATVHHSPGA
jgi:hypothetical protein